MSKAGGRPIKIKGLTINSINLKELKYDVYFNFNKKTKSLASIMLYNNSRISINDYWELEALLINKYGKYK
jgi:hypothetical protein